MSSVSGWFSGWDFYQPHEFVGQILVSLRNKGIDNIEITKEQIEDDAYTLVTIHRAEDYERGSIKLRWTLKGHPDRAKPPLGPPPRIIVSDHVREQLDWVAQLNNVNAVTICKNPRDGGWACFITFHDKRPWWKRWFTARPRLLEGWGETPTDSMLTATTIVEGPR